MERSEIDTQLVLVSARESRVGDHWDKDDYDVRLGDASGPVVGRIMRHPQASEEQTVYNRGYAASREQALPYFKARYLGPSN
jgi:hypothetical protein